MKKILMRRRLKIMLINGLILRTLMAMVSLMNKSSLNLLKNWMSNNRCQSMKSRASSKATIQTKRRRSTSWSLQSAFMQCLDFLRMILPRKKMMMTMNNEASSHR